MRLSDTHSDECVFSVSHNNRDVISRQRVFRWFPIHLLEMKLLF